MSSIADPYYRKVVFLIKIACVALYATASYAGNLIEDIKREAGNCFSGGCDVVWHLNRKFDQGIQSKSESLVGPAKQAFDASMKELFEKQLTPLISTIDSMAAARILQSEQAANNVISSAESGVNRIIENAYRLAQNTTSNIQEVVRETSKEAAKLVETTKNAAIQVINAADCALSGTVEGARVSVSTMFSLPKPWDSCHRNHGFYITTPKSDDYMMIYRIRQCQIKNDILPKMPISELRDQYVRLAQWSQTMRCVMRHNNLAIDTLDQDIAAYTRSYQLWNTFIQQQNP